MKQWPSGHACWLRQRFISGLWFHLPYHDHKAKRPRRKTCTWVGVWTHEHTHAHLVHLWKWQQRYYREAALIVKSVVRPLTFLDCGSWISIRWVPSLPPFIISSPCLSSLINRFNQLHGLVKWWMNNIKYVYSFHSWLFNLGTFGRRVFSPDTVLTALTHINVSTRAEFRGHPLMATPPHISS